ncbi:MAG: class I SAM-dependent methyltransferase [Candidatus Thorarchaeota archaeon]
MKTSECKEEEKRLSDFPINWSDLQTPEEMDINRYFEYDSFAMEMFKRWLPVLKESSEILEVGSGSGFFTGKLHQLYPKAAITCLEPDPKLRKTLQAKFKDFRIIESTLEDLESENIFDMSISHIVIHNLRDALAGIRKMKQAVKKNGFVACIEPTQGWRHILPDDDVRNALDILWKFNEIICRKRSEGMGSEERLNPFTYSYPEFFEELGLRNITCYGWCSIFTLSDNRFDFNERKRWIRRRKDLYLSRKDEITRILEESGIESETIEGAYSTIFDYFGTLEDADEESLSHIHEQEIVNRVITIGQKS